MPDKICQYYLNCDFFNRFKPDLVNDDKVTMFHEIVEVYCFGAMKTKCHRYIHSERTGESPDDDIAPNGKRYSTVLNPKSS